MSDLKTIRRDLKNSDRVRPESSGAYLDAIQDIKMRMNAAKVGAMREAEEPFLVELRELETDYAVFLQLSQ